MKHSTLWQLTFLFFLCVPTTSFAQETCGNFIFDNFGETEIEPIEDCDNPFGVTDSDRVTDVSVTFDGQPFMPAQEVLVDALPYTLPVSSSYVHLDEDPFTFPTEGSLVLYQHQGTDYIAINGLSVSEEGTYTLVHAVQPLPVLSQRRWDQILDWFIPTAWAQGFGIEPLEVTAITFTVAIESAEPECGSLVLVDENGDTVSAEVIADCDNPFDEVDGDVVFNVIADLMQEPFIDLTDGVVVPVESLPADVSFSSRYSVPAGTTNVREIYGVLYQHLPSGDYSTYSNKTVDTMYFVPGSGTYTFVLSIFLGNDAGELELSERVAVTFEIVESDPEPQGASSILFLPGIQASRLYAGEDISVPGGEDIIARTRLWEVTSPEKLDQLEMDLIGGSVREIYTKDVIDEILLPLAGPNVYKGFLDELDNLSTEVNPDTGTTTIAEYLPFAYDWRYSVFDVATEPVKYPNGEERLLVDEVLQMAENSHTGKVTIVAHSNGGLVAKALIQEYMNRSDELDGKIDKLIMIGTPQLGTPKGVSAMLHGKLFDGTTARIYDPEQIRQLIKNFPGVYTLLPSNRYLEEIASIPLITTDGSVAAADYERYGVVTTRDQLRSFALDTDDTFIDSDINTPTNLNQLLFDAATTEQVILDNWIAPDEVEVYEVVGVGAPTPASLEYQQFACRRFGIFGCSDDSLVKPYIRFDNQGDQTVIAGSASGYEGEKVTIKLDLVIESVEAGLFTDINHSNLTESDSVQSFVESAIKFNYLGDELIIPDFEEVRQEYTIASVHSPVDLQVTTESGLVVGKNGDQIIEEVPGSQYLEFGGSAYVIMPKGGEDYVYEITGSADDVFTLRVDDLGSNSNQIEVAQIIASTTDTMIATLQVSGDVLSNLFSDLDGDGGVDQEWTLAGELVPTEPVEVSYDGLLQAIDEIKNQTVKRYLKRIATKAQYLHERSQEQSHYKRFEIKLLRVLEKTTNWLERKGIIENETAEEIITIIKTLKE